MCYRGDKYPASWYEWGEMRFPGESPEFYRMFALYWGLRAYVEQLQDLMEIEHETVHDRRKT